MAGRRATGGEARASAGGLAALGCLGIVAIAGALVVLAALVPAGLRAQAALRERLDRREAAPPGGEWVRAGDVELHIIAEGPRSGPPVVLIHGSGAWAGTWYSTLDDLAAAGYRAIALDLPPFGFSERPPPASGAYTTEAQAVRVVALLDELDLHGVTLVGHSFGGLATVEAAVRAPARVERLVLVDVALGLPPTGRAPAPQPASAPVLRAALGVPAVRSTLASATFTDPWFIPVGLRAFVADPASAGDASVSVYRRPLGVAGTTRAIGAWIPELVAPSTAPSSADPATYEALALPTLIVWGREDTATPLDQAERLHALIRGSRLAVLDGVGHIPQIEDPDALDAALLRFLAQP
jgi:pimeloyl-ACP methyl ester carboxylesterase